LLIAEQFDAGERQAVRLHAAREDAKAPLAARLSVALSLTLWISILACGRMLAPFSALP